MPESKHPLKVFLCHAHADRDAVHALYNRLVRDGVDAWFDKEKLLPGQDWELEIRKAVREADVVVVCLSKQFNQAGFRQKEVRIALEEADKKPEGEIFIIPARLEECDNLESLSKWQWVDLFEEDGHEMLKRALRARAEKIGAELRQHKSRGKTAPRPKVKQEQVDTDEVSHAKVEKDVIEKARLDAEKLEQKGVAKERADRELMEKSRLGNRELKQEVPKLPDNSIKLPSKATSIFSLYRLNSQIFKLALRFVGFIGVIIVLFGFSLWIISKFPLAVMAAIPSQSPTAELTLTPFKPVPSVSPSETVTPSITPTILTITPTLTFTPVPTPITSNILIMENGSRQSCRVSPNGEIVDYIVSGTNVLAFGRDENSDWLFVKNQNIEKYCWINIGGVKYQTDEIAKLPLGMIYSKDAEMVLIPSGEFTMGDYIGTLVDACKHFDNTSGRCDSQFFYDITIRDINLPSFYIDRYEVSNLQYKECVDAGICNPPTSSKSKTHDKYYGNVQYDKYPVVYVTWEMASAYCQKWRDGRLPSEAEWEKASRGADKRLFPWGNEFTGKEANFCDKNCDKSISYDDGHRDTAPINSYFQGLSPYGIYNMSGNVWEWVMDQYANDYRMVFRGGAWNYPIYSLFSSNRGNNSMYYSENSIGFRCARDANP